MKREFEGGGDVPLGFVRGTGIEGSRGRRHARRADRRDLDHGHVDPAHIGPLVQPQRPDPRQIMLDHPVAMEQVGHREHDRLADDPLEIEPRQPRPVGALADLLAQTLAHPIPLLDGLVRHRGLARTEHHGRLPAHGQPERFPRWRGRTNCDFGTLAPPRNARFGSGSAVAGT